MVSILSAALTNSDGNDPVNPTLFNRLGNCSSASKRKKTKGATQYKVEKVGMLNIEPGKDPIRLGLSPIHLAAFASNFKGRE